MVVTFADDNVVGAMNWEAGLLLATAGLLKLCMAPMVVVVVVVVGAPLWGLSGEEERRMYSGCWPPPFGTALMESMGPFPARFGRWAFLPAAGVVEVLTVVLIVAVVVTVFAGFLAQKNFCMSWQPIS